MATRQECLVCGKTRYGGALPCGGKQEDCGFRRGLWRQYDDTVPLPIPKTREEMADELRTSIFALVVVVLVVLFFFFIQRPEPDQGVPKDPDEPFRVEVDQQPVSVDPRQDRTAPSKTVAPASDTYCLNVESLARSRTPPGSDWRMNVPQYDRERCNIVMVSRPATSDGFRVPQDCYRVIREAKARFFERWIYHVRPDRIVLCQDIFTSEITQDLYKCRMNAGCDERQLPRQLPR
jgi:hypothetical protein